MWIGRLYMFDNQISMTTKYSRGSAYRQASLTTWHMLYDILPGRRDHYIQQ